MARIPYRKPVKTYQEQLHQLKSRGLRINSDQIVIEMLEKLGYYRLSGYWYPLLREPKKAHSFKGDADFDTVIRLYNFDQNLRIFILNELEKSKSQSGRSLFINYLTIKDAFGTPIQPFFLTLSGICSQ